VRQNIWKGLTLSRQQQEDVVKAVIPDNIVVTCSDCEVCSRA